MMKMIILVKFTIVLKRKDQKRLRKKLKNIYNPKLQTLDNWGKETLSGGLKLEMITQ